MARASAGEADFFAAKALLGGLLERFASTGLVGAPSQWPFLHPGRSAAVLAGDGRARSASSASCTRSSPARWDLERTAAFAIDLGKLAALAPALVEYTRVRAFPAAAPGPRGDAARAVPAARRARARARRGAASCSSEARVFDVYAGEQVGEGRRSLALALSFRALERTLTDEDIDAAAREDRRGAAARSAVSCVASVAAQRSAPGAPRVIVAGATGFAGALAAHLLWRHPDFELVAVTGRSELGTRAAGALPALPRAARRSSARRSSASRASTRRSSPTRTPPPRRPSAALRERGVRVVDLSADFRLRSLADLRALVRRASASRADRRRPSTG